MKDAFHEYVVNGNKAAVNPAQVGTKAAALYELKIPAQSSAVVRLRLTVHNPNRARHRGASELLQQEHEVDLGPTHPAVGLGYDRRARAAAAIR